MENIIIKLRAISSLLVYMSYAEDEVQDKELALTFLANQISLCAEELKKLETENQ